MAMKYNMKRKAKKAQHFDDGGSVAPANVPATPSFGSDSGAAALGGSGGGGGGGGGGGLMSMLPMLMAAAEGGEALSKKKRAVNAFRGHSGVTSDKGVHADISRYGGGPAGMSGAGKMVRENGEDDIGFAKDLHRRKLDELKSMKKPDLMAQGGEAHHDANKGWSQKDKEDFSKGAGGSADDSNQPDPFKHESTGFFGMAGGGRVDRIMKKRHMMSEGGMMANDDGKGAAADHDPNEFDDLVLDDHLSMHETGANSGDELGNEQMDHDNDDIVSRIMKSRAKKDRNPRPA